MKENSNIKNNKNEHNSIRLSNHSTQISKDNSNYNNKINKNIPETSTEKLKRLLELRKVGPDGKRIHKEININNIDNNKNNKTSLNNNQIIKKNKIKDKKYNFDYDDDSYSNSFIDDGEIEQDADQVKHFFRKVKKIKEEQKKNEAKCEVEVANYDTIQEEEDYTRRIGKKEDEEELKKIREMKNESDYDDEDDDYY